MRNSRRRGGFTLVEALVALSIALMASAALSLSLTSALQHTDYALEQTIAQGLAEQLLDEALGMRYADDPNAAHLGPEGKENGNKPRDAYDDIDDFNGVRDEPPEDPWGVALGKDNGEGGERHPAFQAPGDYLGRWRREVKVYYVEQSDPSRPSNEPTDLRAVEARVYRVDPSGEARLLTTARRVVSYVP